MSNTARLVLLIGKNKGKEFALADGENLIGRADPDSEEVLAVDLDEEDVEAKVSRQHAVILLESNHAFLEDLGSLNGTFVKTGELTQLPAGTRHELHSGDEFVVGKVSLRFELA